MEKNSFSLLETVLSLIILSILVSGFIPFTYKTTPKALSINPIKNLLVLHQTNDNIQSNTLTYELVGSTFQSVAGTSFTRHLYSDSILSLHSLQANQSYSSNLAFETFE